jgi:hypothetical protein
MIRAIRIIATRENGTCLLLSARAKHEDYSKNKTGQREYLNNSKTTDLTRRLYSYFESIVEIPRMKHGRRQTVETLINEEAFLLAQYLRDEHEDWSPRIAI